MVSAFLLLVGAVLLLLARSRSRAVKTTGLVAATLLTAVPASMIAAGQPVVHYRTQPTNTLVTIQGDSTVHEWQMKGTSIGGWVEFPAGVKFDPSQTTLPGLKDGLLPATVNATILVRSMQAQVDHMADTMDGLMRDALLETNFPRIIYHVSELKLQQPHLAGKPFGFDAKGDLAIAGVTNKESFPVTIVPLGTNKIVISGEAKFKMTDFKIKPPAPNFGLGMMKCADDVKILFQWTLMETPPAP